MRNNDKTNRLICPDCHNNHTLKLPEGVAPATAVAYGDFSIRFVAALIDSTVLLVLNGIFQFAVFGSAMARVPNTADLASKLPWLGLSILISIAVACSYETFFIGKMAATPGKMALGLKVMRPDGSPVSYRRAAGRYFAKILSTITLGIGYIMAEFDCRKRAPHDLVCDTRVVGAEVPQLRAPLPKQESKFANRLRIAYA